MSLTSLQNYPPHFKILTNHEFPDEVLYRSVKRRADPDADVSTLRSVDGGPVVAVERGYAYDPVMPIDRQRYTQYDTRVPLRSLPQDQVVRGTSGTLIGIQVESEPRGSLPDLVPRAAAVARDLADYAYAQRGRHPDWSVAVAVPPSPGEIKWSDVEHVRPRPTAPVATSSRTSRPGSHSSNSPLGRSPDSATSHFTPGSSPPSPRFRPQG